MHIASSVLLGAVVAIPSPVEIEHLKAVTEALVKSLAAADAIFTAEGYAVERVENNPASRACHLIDKVTFKEGKPLKGKVTNEGVYFHDPRDILPKRVPEPLNLEFKAKGKLLVAVKGERVLAVVPATDANLALAKKAAEEKK